MLTPSEIFIRFFSMTWVAKDLAFDELRLSSLLAPVPYSMSRFFLWIYVIEIEPIKAAAGSAALSLKKFLAVSFVDFSSVISTRVVLLAHF